MIVDASLDRPLYAPANRRWTQEELDRLEALWAIGSTSNEIAHIMGRSRNSILGAVHRKGLTRLSCVIE